MKNQIKKPTKAQKQYTKDHKKPKRRAVKQKAAPERKTTTATKTIKRQGRTIVAQNTNPERRAPYTVVMEERFKDISKTKTPQKRRNGQAQRQIKVINIRI